jgi:hypothetical protein
MDARAVIRRQYHAAMDMLEDVIRKCPDDLWLESAGDNAFWQVAYHALFYTHLYLQESEDAFRPWPKHREESNFLGPLPWPPHDEPKRSEPYSREDVLEYLAFCRGEVVSRVEELRMEGPSGFEWLPFGKLELQLYSIRHMQQHVGELAVRLGERGVEVPWVGSSTGWGATDA